MVQSDHLMADGPSEQTALPNDHFEVHVKQRKTQCLQGKETSGCCGGVLSRSTCDEIKGLFTLAWPTVLAYFFYHLVAMISLFFAGRVGEVELAAGTLAISFINVTGPSIYIGLGSALETLSSQAFGAKNFRMVGVVLQRGVWILGITCILTWALWINTELLLLTVHQKKNVAYLTQEFVLICLPASIGNFLFLLLQRYLQTQGIVKPILYVGLVSNGVQIAINALMMFVFNLGLRGVAFSWALSTMTMFLLMFAYMKAFKLHKQTWPGWTTDSLLDWGQFIKLGVSGMVMLCIEWWSFELGAFLAGTFGEVQWGTYGIIFQWAAFLFMIPLGISVAAGVRVGNALGAGNAQAAKKTVKVALLLVVCIELVVFAVFFGLQETTGRLFTDNSDVLSLYKKTIRLMSAFFFFDGIKGACSGIVRGSGRQTIGVVFNFISYCCFGLPLGISLMFLVFDDVTGLWIGLFCGTLLQAFLYVTMLWRTDWEKQGKLAQQRTGVKSVKDQTCDNFLNGEIHKKEPDVILSSWIYKSSSLPFLSRFDADNAQFRLALLSRDMSNGQHEFTQQGNESKTTTCDVQDRSRLTSSEKKSLMIKRLIPLIISLLILGAAVAIHLLVPLPSSHETALVGNDTLNHNITSNVTTKSPTLV
ncbi:multidrug and toxin extrusion protein 2-like [Oculina patagonica]